MPAVEIQQIRIQHLYVAEFHHRSNWTHLPSLRDSILANGVISPLVVRKRKAAGYEVGAGVCRMKAATMAELKTVPCIVVDLDDEDFIALQVDENRQRADLHPLDEALYCEELQKRGQTNEQIAKRLGMKKRDVIRRLALIALSDTARKAFVSGRLDEEAALALAQLRDAGRQKDVLSALDAGTLLPEEIPSYVRRTFTADLDDVPWRKTDEQLVVKAGACSTCPKRSDVQRDLFPDGTPGIRCLDVDCYRGKMEAVFSAESAKEGASVLVQEADTLFIPISTGRPQVIRSSGMVDEQAQCPHVDNYTWGEAVKLALPEGAEAPTVYLARDQDGRPRYMMREALVSKIVKKSDLAKAKKDDQVSGDPHRPDDAAPTTRGEGKIRRKLILKLAEAAIATDHEVWPWIVSRILSGCTARSISAAAELLDSSIKHLDPPGPDGIEGLIHLAQSSTRQARRVATAALVFEEADVVGDLAASVKELAAVIETDLAALEAEIRGPSA